MKRRCDSVGKVSLRMMEVLKNKFPLSISGDFKYGLENEDVCVTVPYRLSEPIISIEIDKDCTLDKIISTVMETIMPVEKGYVCIQLYQDIIEYNYGYFCIEFKSNSWVNPNSAILIENCVVNLLEHYYEINLDRLIPMLKDGSLFEDMLDTTKEFIAIVNKLGLVNMVNKFGKDKSKFILENADRFDLIHSDKFERLRETTSKEVYEESKLNGATKLSDKKSSSKNETNQFE